MRGEVQVFYLDDKIEEGSNLLLDGIGRQIIDILTVPKFIENTSFSSILDTSNYVIQGISFSKDALGYNRHAHASVFSAISADGKIRVLNNSNTSSYDSSNINGKILPEQPIPHATRLETDSVLVSGVSLNTIDNGHNHNMFKDTLPSPEYGLIGCYPPSSNITVYILSSTSNMNSPIYSATLSGNNFNHEGFMRTNGILMRSVSSLVEGRANTDASSYSGLMISYEDGWDSSDLKIKYVAAVSADDQFFANVFGGIYSLGLWGIDIRETLRRGYTPPYNLQSSIVSFRLLAKKSFTRDITRIEDNSGSAGFELLKSAVSSTNPGLVLTWNIYFK